jgi:hypothetical protein
MSKFFLSLALVLGLVGHAWAQSTQNNRDSTALPGLSGSVADYGVLPYAPPATQTCWDGSVILASATCPAQPATPPPAVQCSELGLLGAWWPYCYDSM